jgi:ubiquinone/menaquinone biosynthesis C-methylase UbiE
MSLAFNIRDIFWPRRHVLQEVGIQPGFRVLDYGCGPGSYILPLAELVGHSGEIYALDIHPRAIEKVQRLASDRGLTNVKTIQSHCNTGLSDKSLDAILLYDTFHNLSEPDHVLGELHRILKPGGILSFSDHHMREQDILTKVTARKLFNLATKGRKTYTFLKEVSKSKRGAA